ncbi:MAG: hypothetical protein HYY04_18625 [Chloroflexi bacterium]|nr:hypothetical protein [Chloroflexota bacterium]
MSRAGRTRREPPAEKKAPHRIRVQLDLRPEQVQLLDLLEAKVAVRSRADLVQEAIGTLLWVLRETRAGRRILSVDPSEVARLSHTVELASPALALTSDTVYDHLVMCPHPWRKQLSLKRRHVTVGQLVATMRANRLSPEEAAEDLDLPLVQVKEALTYYEAHRDLVDAELQEEKSRLHAKGYAVEPAAVS